MVIHRREQWQEAYILCGGRISNTALVLYKRSFHELFSATVFTFLCAYWWLFCHLKWPSSIVLKCCLVVLSRRSWCAWQDVRVLGKLCSGVSYTAAGCDFEVDAPTIHIELGAFRRKHVHKVMCWISGTNVVSRGSQELNPAFPWGRGVQYSLTLCPRCLYKTWLPQITHATEKINVNWRRRATWTFRDHWSYGSRSWLIGAKVNLNIWQKAWDRAQ